MYFLLIVQEDLLPDGRVARRTGNPESAEVQKEFQTNSSLPLHHSNSAVKLHHPDADDAPFLDPSLKPEAVFENLVTGK